MKFNFRTLLSLLIGSVLFAAAAHAFFFYQSANGQFMVGPNDGTAQMLPFKQFLYSLYSEGSFFYSLQFGLGGGIFSQLAYYFATSTVFFLTFLVIYSGEVLGLFADPDTVLFWGQAAVFVNAFRLAAVVFITSLVFCYMNIKAKYAFIGAVLYGGSVMYFRHAAFWEFFADAYLWLPLLVLGVEKIIREQKPWWLIAAIALSLVNNFYFAYMNFLFIGLYALLRFFFPLSNHESSIKQQLRLYIPSVLIGFLIGAIAFIPAVYGYVNNYRPAFTDPIKWVELHDNVFYTSRLLILPAIFIFCLFARSLYKQKPFRFFAFMALLFVAFHYSPMIGSVFNGFSAPQYRFQYMGSFLLAAAVAFALPSLKTLAKRDFWIAFFLTGFAFALSYLLGYETSSLFQSGQAYLLMISAVLTLVLLLFVQKHPKVWMPLLLVSLAVLQLGLANIYQKERLYENGNLHNTSAAFLQSHEYDHDAQQELLAETVDERPLSRVEWVADFRNNTPLVQDFHGTSAYSSVLNKHLLFFYYHDLQIDMNRESVSRYSGFGDRANLHSLFQVKYKLADQHKETPIPYGFSEVANNDRYTLYENENVLPFARVSSSTYSEDQLSSLSILDREHAMLEGIIVEPGLETAEFTSQAQNRINEAEIEAVGGTYENGRLTVTEEIGGLDIYIGERDESEIDDYLSFYLRNNSETAPLFQLTVNEFKTSRKSRESIYRTDVNHITIRVAANDVLSLRVPEGSYTLDELALYTETYRHLDEAVATSEDIPVQLSSREISIDYNNDEDNNVLAIPVPYEKGWEVEVNGEKAELLKVNYAFLGVPLQAGENHIVFSYWPPFFRLSALLTATGLLLAAGWAIARKKQR
ncbi:YfhO family protein [Shouchella clausii]|uniref:YfhO family protein n=1 Tax=Shouchella clausii TaxID=79880 RepID=UPI0015E71D7F|nr:YfhO family protein [Shouchella clausii]